MQHRTDGNITTERQDGAPLPYQDALHDRGEESHGKKCCYKLQIAALIVLLGVVMLCNLKGVPFSDLSRDPLAVAHGKPYFGFLSNLGILFWCSAAAICLFTGLVVRSTQKVKLKVRFVFSSATITVILLMDDLYMLHEHVFPEIMGIRQRYVLISYAFMMIAYVFYFRKAIFNSSYAFIFIFSLFCFFVSLVVDYLSLGKDNWQYILEDGFKFIGIVSWYNYFFHVCRDEITCHFRTRPNPAL